MESKYKLAFCTFFNAYIHGKDENSSPNIDSHFLILHSLDVDVFYNSEEFLLFMTMMQMSRNHYCRHFQLNPQWTEHPVIRNYKNAVLKKNHISFEIVEHIELEGGGEHVAIYKTFWLRIFQRKWKKYHRYKMQRMRTLLKPYGFLLREIGNGNGGGRSHSHFNSFHSRRYLQ